jgi:hypothetical protein
MEWPRAEAWQAEFPLAQVQAAAKVLEQLAGRWFLERAPVPVRRVRDPSGLFELEQRIAPSRVERLPTGFGKERRPVQAVRVKKLNLRQLKLAGLAVSGTTGWFELARA